MTIDQAGISSVHDPEVAMHAESPADGAATLRLIRHLTEFLTAALFLSFVIITLAQVFCRYVLNDSLMWSEEYVRFALFWVTMLAMAIAVDRGHHICMDGFELLLPVRLQRPIKILAHLVTVSFCALLLWQGSRLVFLSMDSPAPVTEVPLGIVYAAAPLGAMLALLFCGLMIMRILRGRA